MAAVRNYNAREYAPRGTVDDLVTTNSCVYGRFDAVSQRTLKDIDFGSFGNERTHRLRE